MLGVCPCVFTSLARMHLNGSACASRGCVTTLRMRAPGKNIEQEAKEKPAHRVLNKQSETAKTKTTRHLLDLYLHRVHAHALPSVDSSF